ncbi:hypothetical protein ACFVXE_38260 [Streptomyces sp. NPDC058231]|uniref:hypothetical protein n=1 Tax=Streptomyces sp. NPDC058231 TaxID=3346392 RepID=UPI0036EAB32C
MHQTHKAPHRGYLRGFLLLILLVALFGLGFLSPVWWVAAAVLIFGLVQPG